MSDKPEDVEAEAIPPPTPEKKKRGRPPGSGKKKVDAEGNPVEAKPKKKESARIAIPPVWNRMIADLPYAVVPILQARTGLPIVEQLPMIDGANVTIDKRTVQQMYESGRLAFDEWMTSFGGIKVHPAVAYFGSVLATVGMAGYLSYLKVQEMALQVKLAEMARAAGSPGGVVIDLQGNRAQPEPQPGPDVIFNGVHVPPVESDPDAPPPVVEV